MAQNKAIADFTSEYAIVPPDLYLCFLGIFVKKMYSNSGETWAVHLGNSVFSKKSKCFVMDGLPSGRTEGYFQDKRFQTAEEAILCVVSNAENVSDHFLNREVADYTLKSLNRIKNILNTESVG